jgi:type II secretory pathway component PulF
MLLFLFGFIIFYFIPNIISLYGGEIPKIGGWAELLISHSLFIKEYFIELFLTCSILIILIIKLVIVSINPLFFSQIKFKLPLLGNLIFKQSLNNLVWALETMLGSGVDILNALSVLENVTNDPVVLSKLKIIQTSVLGGNSLSDSIVDAKISEPNLLYFVNIGEETGDLENRLNNLSYLYTQEIKRKSKELTSMAQPVFITIITLAIGITMLTIIMPLLDYELLYKI